MSAVGKYFHECSERFGTGWNRFWFTPSDPLPLGVVRVLTALVGLGVYLTYWPDLQFLFGPNGILSRDAMLKFRGDVRLFSIFDYATTPTLLTACYWAGAAMLVLMLLGLFTRVTTVLALVFYLSLIHRGPVVARPVDDILAMVMLYLCIGPSGATLSLDALMRGPQRLVGGGAALSGPAPTWTATLAIRLIQVHISVVYFAMAVAKLKGTVWWDGTAVWGLIAKPESRLIDLTWLAGSIYLINIWTLAIVAFEFAFSLLVWHRMARPLMLDLCRCRFGWGRPCLTGWVSFRADDADCKSGRLCQLRAFLRVVCR